MGQRRSLICSEVMTSAGHAPERRFCVVCWDRVHGQICWVVMASAGASRWRRGASWLLRNVSAGDDKHLRCVRAQGYAALMQ
eukprot:7302200-Alexandrium_andersonii.AAC.1